MFKTVKKPKWLVPTLAKKLLKVGRVKFAQFSFILAVQASITDATIFQVVT